MTNVHMPPDILLNGVIETGRAANHINWVCVNNVSSSCAVGAAALDRERGILFVVERQADGEKSLIHAFKMQ
jgi:hypothetical protein